MTPELQYRLVNSIAPFDGECIRNLDSLSLARLREILSTATLLLSPNYPTIYSYHDWHEHDGFIVESELVSWSSFRDAVTNDRTLFESRDDDFDVRIAIYPPKYDWLLRYNIDQDDENDFSTSTCDFDLSIANATNLFGLTDELLRLTETELIQCPSQPWFQSNCGG